LSFQPDAGKIKVTNSFVSKVGESVETRRRTAHEAVNWYAAIAHDIFG
jgi:hypothetical protein